MGKTTIALALLHNHAVVKHYRDGRLFLSCEALIDADTIVVSLAKLLGISATRDLLTSVIAHLKSKPRMVLVLDNLETVWLREGAPAAAVDELLGRLAQVPALSLVVTCRGTDLPQCVDWSNSGNTVLEPFSLDAALETFQDRAGDRLVGIEVNVAKELLNAVDKMPLAVSLLGQLARRGNSISELLDRWNRTRTSLLCTHRIGRVNNVAVSVELSIGMVGSADGTRESLQLLSLCSTLPDGLRRNVFRILSPQFADINRARDNLLAYSLASVDSDGVLKVLSPVRHHVLERYPLRPSLYTALSLIYFDIAQQMPQKPDEYFRERAAISAPEINNLSSLLLTMVHQPSQDVVDAVHNLAWFLYWYRPSVTVALALVPYLEPYVEWKARCMKIIGSSQAALGDHQNGIFSLSTSAQLFLDIGDRFQAAWCKCATGDLYRLLGKHDQAEALLHEARQMYQEQGGELGEAMCRKNLGILMQMKRDYAAALEHLSAARKIYNTLRETFSACQCTKALGGIYLDQGDLDSAAVELEAARSASLRLGDSYHVAESTRSLGVVRRRQGDFGLAEQLLRKAEIICTDRGDRLGLANCAFELGYLRIVQGRQEQAIVHFKLAHLPFQELQITLYAEECRKQIETLEHTGLHTSDDS